MTLCTEELQTLELFKILPESRLEWVCDRATPLKLSQGEILVSEGDAARGLFILMSGKIAITRYSDGVEMPLGQHIAPEFVGEIPILTDEPIMVNLRGLTDCRVYELPPEDFLELLHQCREFEVTIARAVQKRLRGLESFIRNREKMAALGTMSAGLAHELNNPAAALVRALKDVTPALIELQRMNLVYGKHEEDEEHTQQWTKIRDDGYDIINNDKLDPMTIADREDELLDWLEDYGVEKAWNLAEPLAAGGVDVKTLDIMMERWRDDTTELRDMGIRWLAISFDVMSTIKNGLRGAERISELVHSMKSYSHLDRGAQQWVDIHQGLEDTIKLFSFKLKHGVEINRCYGENLPKILAYGSELNQVWTNLIDNAIDAMEGKGTIEIKTSHFENSLKVEIIDSGTGVPEEVQSRIYEPFFTTKGVGKGSGLGLDAVRRIVENRHKGAIYLESKPGKTTFKICLPIAGCSHK
ncbi:histidine kinase with cyclic nucleotide-binding domain [Rivularia sp. PCC 7116]|uniref:sensor histidine kinase n=1 Tax=Rivularia sp. PCC 7116 TaxID=373994 RepID=UPI00029F4444|nr:ATP-binding protein [Rivularia sp. PCC 7116]AFY58823.1 histidine kinase with cyclic nucleotide-binding domain [Rivularia sp. PCC 7116]